LTISADAEIQPGGKKKKPYKIKLSKKAALLGLARNKHWVLLANVLDPTCFKIV
jgi:hypothetical protein